MHWGGGPTKRMNALKNICMIYDNKLSKQSHYYRNKFENRL